GFGVAWIDRHLVIRKRHPAHARRRCESSHRMLLSVLRSRPDARRFGAAAANRTLFRTRGTVACLRIMLVWTDIENQPQVQYLLPVIEACRRRGARTVISARDDGGTLTLLENRD